MRDFDYRQITHRGGPFHFPANVAIGGDGAVYVCDGYGNAAVHRFSPAGELTLSWGEPGDGPNGFNVPHGIACDHRGRVIVADRENSRLQFFDRDGRYLESWTDVTRPTEVYAARDGLLYVTELGTMAGLWPWMGPPQPPSGRISVFDGDGKLLRRAATGFYAPHDLWLDNDGWIWMAEVVWSAGGRRGEAPEWARTLHRLVPDFGEGRE
jgi:sugar lactone lactonase YvrE